MYKTYIIPMKITVEVVDGDNIPLIDITDMLQKTITVNFNHEIPVLGVSILAVTDIDVDFLKIKEK